MRNIKSSGYVALSLVLVMLAVIIVLTLTMTYSAVGEAQSGLALFQGEENLQQAEGCLEDYILKIRSNPSFTAQNIDHPDNSGGIITCTITINSGNPNWDITVSTQTTNYKRNVRITFTRASTGITLVSWGEI